MDRRHWLRQSTLAAFGLAAAPTLAHSRPRFADPDVIRLSSNENPHGPSPKALEAMQTALRGGNRYPNAQPLAKLIAEREGLSPDHVMIAQGSFEVLNMAGTALGIDQGEIIVPDPTFPIFELRAESAGATLVKVPVTDKQGVDLDAMMAAVSPRTRAVYLCNPNNPTGTLLPASSLRPFCEALAERTTVFVDEAYHELVTDPGYESMVSLVREGANVIVSRTFSKIYGLAGLRIGYALAPPALVQQMRAFSAGPVNNVGLAAAIASMDDHAFAEASVQRNAEARAVLTDHLQALGIWHADSHTNFVWANFERPMRPLYNALREQGIRIGWPADPDQPWGRISMGTVQDMRQLNRALTAVL
ncbi:MAG: histidinol-phosphate transaminase [Bacteroidota bacterium]